MTRVRFTLLHLTIAVVVVACFLGLLETSNGFLIVCVLFSFLLAAMFWSMLRGQRRLAWCGFGTASIAVNCSVAALCIYSLNMSGIFAMVLGSLFGIPPILGFGAAWAAVATRPGSVRRRSPLVAWPLVFLLAVLPLTIMGTQWPFHLAFRASRPALDRLADRVAAGQVVRGPRRAGLFMVVGSAVDPATGNIGLITDANPSGRSGFVRVGLAPGMPPGLVRGLFYNLNGDFRMGGRWRYQSED